MSKSTGEKTESEVISKSEAARRWGVSPAMVTRYIADPKYKMPTLPDGRLDWQVVSAWREAKIIPQLSGSYYARCGAPSKAPVAKRVQRYRERSARVKEHEEIATQLLSKEASAEFFCMCLRFGLSERQSYALVSWHLWKTLEALDDDIKHIEPDWSALLESPDDLIAFEDWFDGVTATAEA